MFTSNPLKVAGEDTPSTIQGCGLHDTLSRMRRTFPFMLGSGDRSSGDCIIRAPANAANAANAPHAQNQRHILISRAITVYALYM